MMASNINPPVCTRLHWEITAFTELVAQSADQKAEKADICSELQAVGQRIWGPSTFVAQHGSSMSGAALRSSDLDIVIGGLTELPQPDNPNGNGYLPGPRAVVAAELEKLMRYLSDESEASSSLDLVPHARMPVLKARMHSTDVKITLSPLQVEDIPAHQTAELVSRAFSDLPHAQKLVLLMKAFLRDEKCLGSLLGVHSGGVSSYTITLMVIAFCKFQAAQIRPDEVDLGLCLLTMLSFYSDASHFNVESHAVDVAADTGFTQKKDAQAALNPEARQAVADRLCAIDPISRHDIGTASYRFTELLGRLRSICMQLHAQMAHAPAAAADVDALQRMSSSTSYRSALSPRRKRGGDSGADGVLPPTPLWVKRYLSLLSSLIEIESLVPLSPDPDPPSPSLLAGATSSPHDLAAAAAAHGAGHAVFIPGHGPLTLGQISNMAYQAAPVAGQFTTEAFPTIQESVAMASTQREGHVRQPELGQFMYAMNQQAHAHSSARFDRSHSGKRPGWGQTKAHRNSGMGGQMRPDMHRGGSHDVSRTPKHAQNTAGQTNGAKKGRSPRAQGAADTVGGSYESNNAGATAARASGAADAANGYAQDQSQLPPGELHAPAPAMAEGNRIGKAPSPDEFATTGHGMRGMSAAALSMRSKSVGTSSSSAVSPVLPLASPLRHNGAIGADPSRAPTDPGTANVPGGSSGRRRSRSEPPIAADVPADRQAAVSMLRGLGMSGSRGRAVGGGTRSNTPSTPGSSKMSGQRADSANRRNRNGSAGQSGHQAHHRRQNSFGSNNGSSWGGRGGMRKKDRNGNRANLQGHVGHGGGPDGRPQHGRGWNGPLRNNGFNQPWRGNHHTMGGGSPAHGHNQQRRGPFPPPNAPAGMQLVPLWPAFPPQQGAQAPYYMVQPLVPLPQPPQQVPPGAVANSNSTAPDSNSGAMPPHALRTPGNAAGSGSPATPAGSGPSTHGPGRGNRPGGTPPGPPSAQQGASIGSPVVWGGAQMMPSAAMIPQQQIMPGQMMYVTVPANAVPPNMAVAGADRKAHGAVPLHLPPHAFGPGGISAPGAQGPHMQGTGFHQRGPPRATKNRNGGRGGATGFTAYGADHSAPRPRGQWGQDGGGRGGFGGPGAFPGNKRRDGPARGGGRWGSGGQAGSAVGGGRD
eukprot:jgi/Ulvmu1/6962/UM033_0019.1